MLSLCGMEAGRAGGSVFLSMTVKFVVDMNLSSDWVSFQKSKFLVSSETQVRNLHQPLHPLLCVDPPRPLGRVLLLLQPLP